MKAHMLGPVIFYAICVAGLFTSLAAAPLNRVDLAGQINARLDHPSVSESFWGVIIESADSGEIWFERNPDRMFVPGSNQKILVAAVAYRMLGPDFFFRTTVRHTGSLVGDVLEGDLVVVGVGDPTLDKHFLPEPTHLFKMWARDLRERGIRRISGNVVGDASLWENRRVGRGWPQIDITPGYYAEYGPLAFNGNHIEITLIPPETIDGKPGILTNVHSSCFSIVNQVEVVEDGPSEVTVTRNHGKNTITLAGRIAAGTQPLTRAATITNPELFFTTVLKEVLEAQGIAVGGEAVDHASIAGWECRSEELPVLIEHASPPLREIVPWMMKTSQNMYSENLTHTIGFQDSGFGSFEAGRRAIERDLADIGIEPGSFRFADGSGLSRWNHVSPRMINAINRAMHHSELRDLWLDTQAVAGVDGTLMDVRPDSIIAGNVRGKTGALWAVRALSGFVTTADGERLIFSFINNGSLGGSPIVDEISLDVLEMLAGFAEEIDFVIRP